MLRNLALILGLTLVAATANTPSTDSHNAAVAGSHDSSTKEETKVTPGTEADKATAGSGEHHEDKKTEETHTK